MEQLIKLDSEVLGVLAGLVIAVTKGLTDMFKINGTKKRVTAILVAAYYYLLYLVVIAYKDDVSATIREVLINLNGFVSLIFTSLGIYSFFPVQMKKDIYRKKEDMSNEELWNESDEVIDLLVKREELKEH